MSETKEDPIADWTLIVRQDGLAGDYTIGFGVATYELGEMPRSEAAKLAKEYFLGKYDPEEEYFEGGMEDPETTISEIELVACDSFMDIDEWRAEKEALIAKSEEKTLRKKIMSTLVRLSKKYAGG